MTALPEITSCESCNASVRVKWMEEEICPGGFFGIAACEKCGFVRLAVAAENAEDLERCRSMVRFAFGADSVVLYADEK
ncbi:hypothetical protein BN873_210007 [Candidatus Competibacter denitrificans Run_A_D11]|uniref:Uncharacterized protein n=2 Tax=Candidatus Competibacter TaxID=221279 RepID=W6M2N6_9GAMM|nr:hypothetical protein BN873_210007 [Candidatus Competibacter denitrificans Run_A_D11]